MDLPPGIIPLLIGVEGRHRSVSAAGATLVLYDHLITINQEKRLIWERKFTFFSYLYILSRYAGDAFVIIDVFEAMRSNSTSELCLLQINISGWLWKIAGLWAQLILICRVWALYHRSKKILAVLLVAWTVQIVLTAYGQFVFFAGAIKPIPIPLTPNLSFCFLLNLPPALDIALWLLPVVLFELLLFVFAAFVCGKQLRSLVQAGEWTHNSLFSAIFRDSLVYFFMAFTIYAALFIATVAGSPDATIPLQVMLTVQIMISTRLILNLRQSIGGGSEETTRVSVSRTGPLRRTIGLASNHA